MPFLTRGKKVEVVMVSSRDGKVFFFFNDTATTEIYTLSLHDALPLYVALSGTTRLLDPWNPTVVLVVLIATVMACWAATSGRTSWVPVVVALASLCVQAHIAFAPPALLLVGFSLVVLTRSVRRGERDATRAVARTALIAAVAWLPLVLDMGPWGTRDLSRVVRFMRSGGGRR